MPFFRDGRCSRSFVYDNAASVTRHRKSGGRGAARVLRNRPSRQRPVGGNPGGRAGSRNVPPERSPSLWDELRPGGGEAARHPKTRNLRPRFLKKASKHALKEGLPAALLCAANRGQTQEAVSRRTGSPPCRHERWYGGAGVQLSHVVRARRKKSVLRNRPSAGVRYAEIREGAQGVGMCL